MWAGVPAEREVFHLFHLKGAVEGGVLHEVKIISCNKIRYSPTWTKRAVDVGAEKLQQEYMVKARGADRVYNNTLWVR